MKIVNSKNSKEKSLGDWADIVVIILFILKVTDNISVSWMMVILPWLIYSALLLILILISE